MILLSHVVFSLMVARIITKTSEALPLLGIVDQVQETNKNYKITTLLTHPWIKFLISF